MLDAILLEWLYFTNPRTEIAVVLEAIVEAAASQWWIVV
jgi:hypothetical protein